MVTVEVISNKNNKKALVPIYWTQYRRRARRGIRFFRVLTRSLYGEGVAVVEASRALTSHADINLHFKPTRFTLVATIKFIFNRNNKKAFWRPLLNAVSRAGSGLYFFFRALTRSLYREEVAVAAASRALTSRAGFNLLSKLTWFASPHRCPRRQFLACSLFSRHL